MLEELIYSKFSLAGSESERSVARRVSSDELPLSALCNLESVRPSASGVRWSGIYVFSVLDRAANQRLR